MRLRLASTPGPKPNLKKNSLKKLGSGRNSKDRELPQPKTEIPSCPNKLTSEAKTIWRTTVAELSLMPGFLARCDREILANFCRHTANADAAQKERDLHGDVWGAKVSPYVRIQQRESELAAKCGDRLGLNPASRVALHLEAAPQRPSFFDPLMPPPLGAMRERLLQARESLTQTVYQRTVQAMAVTSNPPDPVPVDPAAGAVVEGQAAHVVEVQPDPVDQQPVEDPATGASNNQDGQPADLPVEPPAACAPPAEPAKEPVKPTRPEPSFHYIGRR